MATNRQLNRRLFLRMAAIGTGAAVLTACATPTPQVVKETVIVKETVPVEKVVPETVVVKETVPVEKVVKETVVVEKTVVVQPTPLTLTGKIEFWGVENVAGNEALLTLLKEMQANTGLTIDFVRAPGGWPSQLDRLAAGIAAAAGPDIAHIKDFNMWNYAWRDALLPLDDYYALGGIDPTTLRPSIWDAMHYKGKVYGVPWKGSFVWGMFLNNTVFQDAGLDPAADAPHTWPQVVEVAKKLTDESAKKYGYAFYDLGLTEPNFMIFSAYAGQAGGRLISQDGTKLTLDTPEVNEAMQWMYDLMWTHKAAVPPAVMASLGDMTLAGSIAMWISGFWSPAGFRANAPQLKFSAQPMHCYKTCDNVDTPECMVMLKGAKQAALSWEAMKLLADPSLDLQRSWSTGWLPAYVSNLDKQWQLAPIDKAVWQVYAEMGKNPDLRPRQWMEGYDEMVAAVMPELQAIWFDKAKVKDGLAAAEKAGNEALARIQNK